MPGDQLLTLSSRAASNALLGGLRAGRWRARAWARFTARAAHRSAHQVRTYPRAVMEVTALHAVFGWLAGPPGRRWVAVSWALAITNLGLLDAQASVGVAGALTLARANLPALAPRAGADPRPRWLAALAIASDLAEGRLARRGDAASAFGCYADSLADAAFWIWFAARHEPSRWVQAASGLVWAAPIVAMTTASIARGRISDPPRPPSLRPAPVMQVVLAARAFVPTA